MTIGKRLGLLAQWLEHPTHVLKRASNRKLFDEQGMNSRKPTGKPMAILSQASDTSEEGAETTGEVQSS